MFVLYSDFLYFLTLSFLPDVVSGFHYLSLSVWNGLVWDKTKGKSQNAVSYSTVLEEERYYLSLLNLVTLAVTFFFVFTCSSILTF